MRWAAAVRTFSPGSGRAQRERGQEIGVVFGTERVISPAGLGRHPVGMLVRGSTPKRAVVEAAARLTSERKVERGLMVMLVRPYIPTHAVLQAGYSADRYTAELDLEARTLATQMLEEAGLQTKFSFFNIARPALRRGARLAAELGCDALLIPTRRHSPLRALYGAYERRFGLSILPVAQEAGATDVVPISSQSNQEV